MTSDRAVTVTLSLDQALVLSDWLDRMMHQPDFAAVVDDRAVWSPLLSISGALETTLPEVFDPSYREQLAAARERLSQQLGELGT